MIRIPSSRTLVLLICVGAIFAHSDAHGQPPPGIDMAWDDCVGSGLESIDRTVACTNDASTVNRVVCSFVTGTTIPQLIGSESIVDLMVDAPDLPAWWTPSLTRYGMEVGTSSCQDLWGTAPSSVGTVGPSVRRCCWGPNRIRIQSAQTLAAGEELTALPDIRYHDNLLYLKFSPGTADDPGCLTPACIVFNEFVLFRAGDLPIGLSGPSTSNYVTWRGGGSIPCPEATPTRKATWGSIKALYR